jgi:hypothetical protein
MTEEEKAYIAGFLDGDGSIMLQLKPRKVVSYGFRVKTVICFYQDTRHENGLSRRKDGISELRVEGFKAVKNILTKLKPFIIFKEKQVKIMLEAIIIMKQNPSPEDFLKVCKLSDKLSSINYATTRKKYNYGYVYSSFVKRGLIRP